MDLPFLMMRRSSTGSSTGSSSSSTFSISRGFPRDKQSCKESFFWLQCYQHVFSTPSIGLDKWRSYNHPPCFGSTPCFTAVFAISMLRLTVISKDPGCNLCPSPGAASPCPCDDCSLCNSQHRQIQLACNRRCTSRWFLKCLSLRVVVFRLLAASLAFSQVRPCPWGSIRRG